MLVDKKSLIDLGVLPNAGGEWPLGRLLDHTHSRPGLDALKGLLAAPLDDPVDIAIRQQLLRALPDALRHVPWASMVALAKDADAYLDSNYIICPDTHAACMVFGLRYPVIARYIESKLVAVSQLLAICRAVHDRIALLGGDALFNEIAVAIDTVVSDPLCHALRAAVNAPTSRRLRLRVLDKHLRVRAQDAMRRLIAALYRLDAYGSLATAARGPGLSYPEFAAADAVGFRVEGIRHPLLAQGVVNDVDVSGRTRVMFLTGPNMAGKSTLLRAIGIVVHFAHVGLPVPAARARLPRVDRLISSLRVDDSLARGESLYLAEVRRVKSVVNAVADDAVVVALLDEVFRGTNAKDAIDATALLVDGLAEAPAGLFVIASHLIEVADGRDGHAGIGLWCMAVDDAGGQHTFTYALRRGVSDVRLGMKLLESEGVAGTLRRLAQRG
ncbi:MAG: hypothetical protein IPP90_23650 [Gemmatimonadaceae bacterium]|nr:hypothetical protein [Gemmatimonadaceae bacterium]